MVLSEAPTDYDESWRCPWAHRCWGGPVAAEIAHLGMCDPDCGVICWNGTDLTELDPAGLRARVGAVFQNFMAYDLTAAENIGVGRLSALDDLDAIRPAARAAGVDAPLAALPTGYACSASLPASLSPPGPWPMAPSSYRSPLPVRRR